MSAASLVPIVSYENRRLGRAGLESKAGPQARSGMASLPIDYRSTSRIAIEKL